MATIARICLQSLLKLVNSVLGMVGIAMVLYGLWMVRVWLRDMDSSSVDQYNAAAAAAPWFICTFLGAGVFLCAITCIGYLAAKFAHDILLNSDWEKDLPYDPTGKFHDFKDFVKSNFDMFKWIGLLIVLAQGFSILLALALKSVEPNQGSSYDSDEECPPARLPLINPNVEPLEYIVAAKNNNWNSNK
ncbi:tetraspanin-19-like isoform X2 [Prunus avium]|uniref:Tetraspanin-19-like isoform X2 n=1 Tax=Prunus avium TaxID=42229 RepID=A0A6P5TFC1_PRUAV|nr:tetraspanin-19-like isoform X2 [Prunus avium]